MSTRKETNRVIFHHSLSGDVSVKTITDWHIARGFDGCGYHYIIRQGGTIEKGRQRDSVGAHAYGSNGDSIGICIVGDFRSEAPRDVQIESAMSIYSSLCFHYKKKLAVGFHRGLMDDSPCPGPKLNRPKFIEKMGRAYDRIMKITNPVPPPVKSWWEKAILACMNWLNDLFSA